MLILISICICKKIKYICYYCSRIAQLECQMVEGVTKASQYNAGDEVSFGTNSSWNAVKINKAWHLLDVNFASCSTNKQLQGWDLLDDNGEVMFHCFKEHKWGK